MCCVRCHDVGLVMWGEEEECGCFGVVAGRSENGFVCCLVTAGASRGYHESESERTCGLLGLGLDFHLGKVSSDAMHTLTFQFMILVFSLIVTLTTLYSSLQYTLP